VAAERLVAWQRVARLIVPPGFEMAALFFAVKLALHVALAGRYGYNGDELYFMACARHLDFGYVDHPPIVPWIAAASTALFGESLFALRIPVALAGALTVALVVVMARTLGGGRFAQAVAGLCVLIAPAFLRMGSILCIPVFENLILAGCALALARPSRAHEGIRWLVLGSLMGLGLLTKHSFLLWVIGLGFGLLISRQRWVLKTPSPWVAFTVAGLLFAPNLIWQAAHHWASLDFLRGIHRDQLEGIPRSLFLLGQMLYMHPFTLPVWVAGLVFFLVGAGRSHRALSGFFLAGGAVLFATHGKPYYLAPAYLPLFAGGAVALERASAKLLGSARLCARAVMIAGLLTGGLTLAPFALPVLPLPIADRWIGRLVGFAGVRSEDLTLEFHQEYGWSELVATVARVYRGLPRADRARATLLTYTYAQAGAIDLLGGREGLPSARSGHMTYWLWGPGPGSLGVVIAAGIPVRKLEQLFSRVEQVATSIQPLAWGADSNLAVYVCRGAKRDLRDAWPEFKRYVFGAP